MASTFRASPWVTYQPNAADPSQHLVPQPPPDPSGTTMVMDMDVDMDAPHISTLNDEDTPPPPAKKARIGPKPKAPKLKVTEPSGHKERKKMKPPSDGEDLDAQDEEDELIDDDDEGGMLASSLPRSTETTPKKKAKAKRVKKEGSEAKKTGKEKSGSHAIASGAPPHLAPTISWFHASPSEAHEETAGPSVSAGTSEGRNITVEGGSVPSEPIILKLSAPRSGPNGAKLAKRTPRKSTGVPRARPPSLLAMDDAMSEAGFSATAMSSPATALGVDLPDTHVPGTPDTEAPFAPSSPATATTAQLPSEEPPNLEGVAIPQYPLPTKPFPVQPAVKITTGFAPPAPLDRSGKRPRHWKIANREIRGIAGGRWFVKTWVGEKESELADALVSSGPKIDDKSFVGHHISAFGPRMSLSAPAARGRGRGGSKTASAVGSAVPSRSGSVIPDSGPSTVKLPTKMRILQLPPSENGDSPEVALQPPSAEPAAHPEPTPTEA